LRPGGRSGILKTTGVCVLKNIGFLGILNKGIRPIFATTSPEQPGSGLPAPADLTDGLLDRVALEMTPEGNVMIIGGYDAQGRMVILKDGIKKSRIFLSLGFAGQNHKNCPAVFKTLFSGIPSQDLRLSNSVILPESLSQIFIAMRNQFEEDNVSKNPGDFLRS
jgi:hypothetical protein